MADANCEVTYNREDDCCDVDLAPPVSEPPPETVIPPVVIVGPPGPQGPPGETGPEGPAGPPGTGEDNGCPYYCGIGSPEGVQDSTFETADVLGGMYEELDYASGSHPWWAKTTLGGTTGWRPWAGLGSEGLLSYRIGDGSLASGNGSLAFGTGATTGAAAVNGIALGAGATLDTSGTGKSGAINGIAIGATRAINQREINIGYNNLGTAGNNGATSNIYIGSFIVHRYGNHSTSTILIGDSVETANTGAFSSQIGIGEGVYIGGWNNVLIGEGARAWDANLPVAGLDPGTYGVGLGENVALNGDCVVGVGHDAETFSDFAVALGPHARAGEDQTTDSQIAVGRFATARGNRSISIGTDSVVSVGHTAGIALGKSAATTAANQLMIGDKNFPIAAVVFDGGAAGTNQTGTDVSFTPGAGTGNGFPGVFRFRGITAVGSGTGAQTVADVLTINSTGIDLATGMTISVNGTQVLTSRQTNVADTTGAALGTVETSLNSVKAVLRAHGLM